jgi:CubicO group peptidase (beta-lactamase class C family)
MGAVLVAKGSDILLDKGYGKAVMEWNIPDSPDVKFRIGSMTKQFTAALVLLEQEDGKLSVDDPKSRKAWTRSGAAGWHGAPWRWTAQPASRTW